MNDDVYCRIRIYLNNFIIIFPDTVDVWLILVILQLVN